MYYGRLSAAPLPATAERRPTIGRRGLLWMGFGFAIGAMTGGAGHALWVAGNAGAVPADRDARTGSATATTPPADDASATPPPARGTLAWARAMTAATDDELLHAAGDLERVTARHRDATDLVPLFVRLLEVSAEDRTAAADPAGACAIRSLVRLGATAAAVDAGRNAAERPGRTATLEAFERARDQLRRGGR